MNEKNVEHGFSVEMKSIEHVKSLSLAERGQESVLFEGILGELKNLGMLESVVLEITGTHGTLMVDIAEEELRNMLSKNEG